MDFLDTLNAPQREAVTTTQGPLLILAGAGSGKTRVITYRIAYLIGHERVAPYHILAVTFTNKAAGEMRERVKKILAGTPLPSAPLISTFHSLCVRILRRDIEEMGAGYTKSFTIYDQDDAVRLTKLCIKDCGYDEKHLAPRATQSAISAAKNRGEDAAMYASRVEFHDEKRAAIARVFKVYEEKLAANNALDFDDLLIKTVKLLRQSQKVRDFYNEKFRYILVDEYQDTNSLQFALISYLTQKQQNICVVGDENQCVVADTPIQTERGEVKASEVQVGNKVLSATGNNNLEYSRVTDVFCRPVLKQPVVTIQTQRGHKVTATPEHIHFAGFEEKSHAEAQRTQRQHSNIARLSLTQKISAASAPLREIFGGFAAAFVSGTSLPSTPAADVQPGMAVYIQTKNGIAKDEVISVKQSRYSGNVYDFNVERTHNFVAGGIFTHNSVYAFRGADIQNILNFEEQYKAAKVIRLEQNYRSTQNIINAADAVIRNNTERRDKKLWTANDAGDKIRYFQARDADEEARFVASKITEHRRRDYNLRAAVLYRTNSQSRVFEEALRRAMIPYTIVGGFSFYERAEVKDIVSYLKLALNPNDSIALLRIINSPARSIGKTTLDELARRANDYGVSHWDTIAAVVENPDGMMNRAVASLKKFKEIIENLSRAVQDAGNTEERVSSVVKAAIEQTGYAAALRLEANDEADARLANLEELVNAAVDFDLDEESTIRDFIDHAALVSATDQLKENSLVTLMSIHAAKGLEFPLVFVVGMEDGLLPHARSARDARELEEERRLCYVALTRAEQHLYISHAVSRRVYGAEMQSEPSQFLNELPLDLLEDLSRGSSWLSFVRKSQESQHTVRALRGETPREKKNYTGETYDSVDAIADFFRKRGQNISLPDKQQTADRRPQTADRRRQEQAADGRQQAAADSRQQTADSKQQEQKQTANATPHSALHTPHSEGFLPGTQVKHPKYGRGLVLRREGSGDKVKLLVNFPGYGPKKLIEKYAGLEKWGGA